MQSGNARRAQLPPAMARANTGWTEAAKDMAHDQNGVTVKNEHARVQGQYSATLIRTEPKARLLLTNMGMQLQVQSGKMCDTHRAELRSGTGIVHEQSIIRDRALMPMCQDCVNQRTEEIQQIQRRAGINRPLTCVDTCVCAAIILTTGNCNWCNIETMNAVRNEYCVQNACDLNTIKDPELQQIGLDLYCKCGKVAMVRETMRNCIVCDGLVSLPLHAIDRTTHLAVPIWKRSQYVGDLSRLSDPGALMGWYSACTKHPLPVLAELLPRSSPANPPQPPQQALSTPQVPYQYGAPQWHPMLPPGVNNRQSVGMVPSPQLPRNQAAYWQTLQRVQQMRPRSQSMVPQPPLHSGSGNNASIQQENGSSPHYRLSTRMANDPSAMPDQVYRSMEGPNES